MGISDHLPVCPTISGDAADQHSLASSRWHVSSNAPFVSGTLFAAWGCREVGIFLCVLLYSWLDLVFILSNPQILYGCKGRFGVLEK